MIEVKDLSFAYKTQKVLEGVSFSLGKGQLIAVLGQNGAGKSTLFRCILGFLKGYEGQILINGTDIHSLSRKQMSEYAAYIPQSETPVFNYTVMDTVMMGTTGMISPLSTPGKEQEEIAEEMIGYLGIDYMKMRGINEISGGERQLVFLARAMAQRAKVLIMDEPTANLDYGNQQHVMNHVKHMAEGGYTILFSTHNPEHALQYATHVLALKDHRVIADGPADEILTEELIEEIYGLKVKVIETEVDGAMVRSCIPKTVPDGRK